MVLETETRWFAHVFIGRRFEPLDEAERNKLIPLCYLFEVTRNKKPANHLWFSGFRNYTQTGTRTQDQLVKSQLLYQLSYLRVLVVVWFVVRAVGPADGEGLG